MVDHEETEVSDLESHSYEDVCTGETVPCTGETVKLQEDRNLFAHIMVICKGRPEIDIKEAVRTYEFRVVPRSMFSADGDSATLPSQECIDAHPGEVAK